MRTLTSLLALALLTTIGIAGADAVSGCWESPGGSIHLDIQVHDLPPNPPLPQDVSVKITNKATGQSVTGVGIGGAGSNAAGVMGPIQIPGTTHHYRVMNGKHQWQNSNWPGDQWVDMKKETCQAPNRNDAPGPLPDATPNRVSPPVTVGPPAVPH